MNKKDPNLDDCYVLVSSFWQKRYPCYIPFIEIRCPFHIPTLEHCTLFLSPLRDRVRTGLGKPGKYWNSIMAFSRAGKSWKKATGPGKFWKSVKLN